MSSPRSQTNFRFGLRAAVIALTAVTALAAPIRAFAQAPAPIDIGNLGGGYTNATAGADGYIAGVSLTTSGEWHPFVWSASTKTMRDISGDVSVLVPSMGPIGITGVNSNGELVGAAWDSAFTAMTGFYWSPATGAVSLGALYPNVQQTAVLINERGVVAGVTADNRLFRWTFAGGFDYLGSLYANSFPYLSAINSHGDIVGGSGDLSAAFVAYASSNVLTTLTSPGTTAPPSNVGATINEGNVNIQINGINDNGVVVGQYWDFEYIYEVYAISLGGFANLDSHVSHPFEWTSAGGFTDLGSFSQDAGQLGANPGGGALAINGSGTIVGYSFVTNDPASGLSYDAFSYQGSGPLAALQRSNAGSAYNSATGINDDGVIVGFSGNDGSGATVWQNGVPQSIVPHFAPMYDSVNISGHTLWGNGFDNNWVTHAWTMALASADTTKPVVKVAPGDQTVEATGPKGAVVTFTATATDPDDTAGPVTCTEASGSTFTLGTTTDVCSSTDTHNNTGSTSFKVTVQDTTPPVITSVTPSQASLWPPNKKMTAISVAAAATDLVTTSPACRISSVTSNEPGAGEWSITGALTLQLQADRLGTGSGRIYTINVTCTDDAGNASSRSTTVSVPHDQSK